MGNYRRPQDNPDFIQADIAYRLGRVLRQYSNFIMRSDEKFEVTLAISTLQTVLTQCVELINTLKKASDKLEHKFLLSNLSDINYFELRTENVITDSTGEHQTVDSFLRHLRNSLSHPTGTSPSTRLPSTGYTTKDIRDGELHSFAFVSSPDVKNGRSKKFDTKTLVEDYIKRAKKDYPRCRLGYVSVNEGFVLVNPRIFHIQLTATEIKHLALKLCTYLAQPIQAQWEIQPYNELILTA